MGMYTLLVVEIELRKDTPDVVLSTLRYMLDARDKETPKYAPPRMEDTRWEYMLCCSSAYFNNPNRAALVPTDDGYWLSAQSSFKNYNDEIEKFITWIQPYCTDSLGQFIVHQYETALEPTFVVMGHSRADHHP